MVGTPMTFAWITKVGAALIRYKTREEKIDDGVGGLAVPRAQKWR
jgi:hypothetical protein